MDSKLRSYLYILLNEIVDVCDLEFDDGEWYYKELIIQALIERSEGVCPFKNYECEIYCPYRERCGLDPYNIDCGVEPKAIWENFINQG